MSTNADINPNYLKAVNWAKRNRMKNKMKNDKGDTISISKQDEDEIDIPKGKEKKFEIIDFIIIIGIIFIVLFCLWFWYKKNNIQTIPVSKQNII